jgi:DNA-binding NarL/FixJ family response regulator
MPTPKILVVEDFERFRQFVVSTLQQSSQLQIIEASNGLEAIQQAEEQQPELVLLDIGLPYLNGIEVARRLRKLDAPPKIVFVSQDSSPEVVEETLNLGALGYVHKTHAHRDLLAAIEAALEGKRFVSNGLQLGEAVEAQTPSCHEILFCSDAAALLDALADFVADALKSGNAALVRSTKSRRDSLHETLEARGVHIDAVIQQGTYAFLDVEEPPDVARVPDSVRRLSEAASQAGKKHPRVAFYSERAGRIWADGNTDEAIRLEQRANELAKHHNVHILCPYPLPHGNEDPSAFKKLCTAHSVVSFR